MSNSSADASIRQICHHNRVNVPLTLQRDYVYLVLNVFLLYDNLAVAKVCTKNPAHQRTSALQQFCFIIFRKICDICRIESGSMSYDQMVGNFPAVLLQDRLSILCIFIVSNTAGFLFIGANNIELYIQYLASGCPSSQIASYHYHK